MGVEIVKKLRRRIAFKPQSSYVEAQIRWWKNALASNKGLENLENMTKELKNFWRNQFTDIQVAVGWVVEIGG